MKKTTRITPKTMKSWLKSTEAPVTQTSIDVPRHSKTFAQVAKLTRAVSFTDYQSARPVQPALARRPKWRDKEYREAYMEAAIEQGVAWQIRINREMRGMTQKDLAKALGTRQSAVSRMEDPNYGAHSLETLIKVAHVFDCALSVKLVSYSQLAFESERLGEAEQCAVPYFIEWDEFHGDKTVTTSDTCTEPALDGGRANHLR